MKIEDNSSGSLPELLIYKKKFEERFNSLITGDYNRSELQGKLAVSKLMVKYLLDEVSWDATFY